ncbi:hypothetical protein L1887_11098 [Cichorium endivia]|nr:hypothetical protein L1887_11098 [Cichorium endivia]
MVSRLAIGVLFLSVFSSIYATSVKPRIFIHWERHFLTLSDFKTKKSPISVILSKIHWMLRADVLWHMFFIVFDPTFQSEKKAADVGVIG